MHYRFSHISHLRYLTLKVNTKIKKREKKKKTHSITHWQLHRHKIGLKPEKQEGELPDGAEGPVDTVLLKTTLAQQGDSRDKPQMILLFVTASLNLLPSGRSFIGN